MAKDGNQSTSAKGMDTMRIFEKLDASRAAFKVLGAIFFTAYRFSAFHGTVLVSV